MGKDAQNPIFLDEGKTYLEKSYTKTNIGLSLQELRIRKGRIVAMVLTLEILILDVTVEETVFGD